MTDCLEIIRSRRTIYQFKPDPVPGEVLFRALEAATWAPNHGLTEPWRFYVAGSATQAALARIYARLRADKRCEAGTEAWQCQFEQALARFEAFPCVVLVGQWLSDDPQQREEDAAAVACAIQNLQLALWQEGVGCQWSTGPVIRAPETRALLQLEEKVKLVAALYAGWPECVPRSRRTDWQEKTRFLQ